VQQAQPLDDFPFCGGRELLSRRFDFGELRHMEKAIAQSP
jgi:hypothetical protein